MESKIDCLVRDMMFFKYINLNHMWYMPMIIGIYVFIPFVANSLKNRFKGIGIPADFNVVLFVCNYSCEIYLCSIRTTCN
jgi:surface polysaccharide O-acyltransferase-like enzyme